MYMPEPPLDRMLTAFEKDHDDGTGWARNLRDAINASPVLRENLERAVDGKHLTGFALSDKNAVENNAYSSKTGEILLNEDTIRAARPGSRGVGELVFALGHETDHALRRPENQASRQAFHDATNTLVQQFDVPYHDYTAPLHEMLEARRTDEAKAHLGGYSAHLSWVIHNNPDATLDEIHASLPHRMDDFIDVFPAGNSTYCELKPGLETEDLFSLELGQSDKNVEAMKHYYYDKPGTKARLGPAENLDYRHHDASQLMNLIDDNDRFVHCGGTDVRKQDAPGVVVDLHALRLDRSQLDTELFRRPASHPAPDIATETDAQERKRKREPEESKADGARPSDPVDTKRARTAPGQSLATPDLSAGTFPGADHPLYRMAHEMLRPYADGLGLDATALQNVAAGIAYEMQHRGSTTQTIEAVFPDVDHQIVFATDRPLGDQSYVPVRIDIKEWSGRTASEVLAKMSHDGTDTPAPTHPHHHAHLH